MKRLFLLLAGLVFCLAAVPAGATTVDFTSSAWSGVSGTSYTVGSITLTSTGGNLTWNGGDGIGISGGGDDDEINFTQMLTVTFGNAPVFADQIDFLDFFKKKRHCNVCAEEAQWGYLGANGITWVTPNQFATATDNTGAFSFDPFSGAGPKIFALYFKGVPGPGEDGDSDFSLARIDFTEANREVPIPAAIWLFGSGLLGLIGIRRRKR